MKKRRSGEYYIKFLYNPFKAMSSTKVIWRCFAETGDYLNKTAGSDQFDLIVNCFLIVTPDNLSWEKGPRDAVTQEVTMRAGRYNSISRSVRRCWATLSRRFPTLCGLVESGAGATAIEYGLIAALVAVAGMAAFTALGDSLSSLFTLTASTMTEIAEELAQCVQVDSNCEK